MQCHKVVGTKGNINTNLCDFYVPLFFATKSTLSLSLSHVFVHICLLYL